MDLTNLKSINNMNADKALLDKRHQELLSTSTSLSDTVLSATMSLIKYLEGHTSKTLVVNQLKSINTPDALRIIPFLEKLDKTLQTHENTDLTEITSVMKSILDETKKIPKELPKEKEEQFIDYTKQFAALGDAVKAVEKVVKAQKLVAEAPIVNVPETNVHVDAPDLKPLQSGLEDIVKAVSKIVIPEYKTDNSGVEELIKKSNKLLKELIDKPVSSGGGGGGRATPYADSAGIPAFVTLKDDSVPVSSGLIPVRFDQISFSNADGNGNYQTGTVKRLSGTVGTLTLAYDASNNLTDVRFV